MYHKLLHLLQQQHITITGTNFVSIPQVEFIKTDGSVTVANSITFTSATSLSVNVTLALVIIM